MAAYNYENLGQAQESCINEDDTQVPEARFECPICLTWLRDPVLTTCGHRFCRKCIYSWLEKETACPVDKTQLDKNTDIFPDNFTRREISQQKTKCPNIVRGCLEELSPLDVEYHLRICKYKPPELPDNEKLRCTYVAFGCREKFETEPELRKHIDHNIQNHLLLVSQAFSNKLVLEQSSTNGAALAQQANFWDPPSKSGSPTSSEAGGNSTEALLRTLYEKLIIMEQKTREQDIIIANMSEQISACNLVISNLTTTYCNGCYVWAVTDFKTKINQMRNDHHIMYYSPGFFTSPFGYKICIRFNLSPKDPNYVAILIHMMKTDHDTSLDWPFTGRISITLVHPSDPVKNIKETMMTRPEVEAFKRPKQEVNPRGFGYTEFVLVEDLFTEGFIDKNQLLIKVHAQLV